MERVCFMTEMNLRDRTRPTRLGDSSPLNFFFIAPLRPLYSAWRCQFDSHDARCVTGINITSRYAYFINTQNIDWQPIVRLIHIYHPQLYHFCKYSWDGNCIRGLLKILNTFMWFLIVISKKLLVAS